MQKWEYLTAPLIVHNTKAILEGPGGGLVAYFKRPKEQ